MASRLLKCAGFVAGALLLMQAVPAVSYGMLVIADGIRVALGWGGRCCDESRVVQFRMFFIRRRIPKAECHAICAKIGLKRPVMYDMGYPNNNCIGCVKGGMGYWNRIRRDFPDVFERRARQEREIGHSCIRGVFLDELDPNRGNMMKEVMPSCGFACEALETQMEGSYGV